MYLLVVLTLTWPNQWAIVLRSTPELGQAANLRFHQRFASLLTEGGLA